MARSTKTDIPEKQTICKLVVRSTKTDIPEKQTILVVRSTKTDILEQRGPINQNRNPGKTDNLSGLINQKTDIPEKQIILVTRTIPEKQPSQKEKMYQKIIVHEWSPLSLERHSISGEKKLVIDTNGYMTNIRGTKGKIKKKLFNPSRQRMVAKRRWTVVHGTYVAANVFKIN
jgi:hypothetical protein